MSMVITMAVIGCALPTIARLIVEAIATVIALQILRSNRRSNAALISESKDRREQPAGWDANPSAAERRLLRRGLVKAIQLTELTSLFPDTVDRARRFA